MGDKVREHKVMKYGIISTLAKQHKQTDSTEGKKILLYFGTAGK